MADSNKPVKESGPWEDYAEKESGPWEDYGGKSSIPGAPEGLPSSGAAEKIANIIPEEEAATRLKNTGYNRMTSPLSPTEQEAKLNAYNPASQLMQATTIGPGGVGLIRAGIRNPVAVGRTLLGAAGGSALGAYGGRELGGIVGHPEVGGEIGATIGGLAGGVMGARGMRVPGRSGLVRDLIFGEKAPVDPVRQAVREGRASMLPTRMPKVVAPEPEPVIDPVRQAVREGRASLIPTRMPRTTAPPAPEPELGSPENPGWVVKLPNRMPVRTTPFEGGTESVAGTRPRSLILTPEEAKAESQMQSVATKRAKERGMQFAGGMTPREGRKVPRMGSRMQSTEYPEPRERVRIPSE